MNHQQFTSYLRGLQRKFDTEADNAQSKANAALLSAMKPLEGLSGAHDKQRRGAAYGRRDVVNVSPTSDGVQITAYSVRSSGRLRSRPEPQSPPVMNEVIRHVDEYMKRAANSIELGGP